MLESRKFSKKMDSRMRGNDSYCGFTLIEILITMLILSVGLLGIAGLEILALRQTQTSYYQSLANVQVAAMLERLRANQSAVARVRECNEWNVENQRLLLGKGECVCQQNNCRVTLRWKNHGNTLEASV